MLMEDPRKILANGIQVTQRKGMKSYFTKMYKPGLHDAVMVIERYTWRS